MNKIERGMIIIIIIKGRTRERERERGKKDLPTLKPKLGHLGVNQLIVVNLKMNAISLYMFVHMSCNEKKI